MLSFHQILPKCDRDHERNRGENVSVLQNLYSSFVLLHDFKEETTIIKLFSYIWFKQLKLKQVFGKHQAVGKVLYYFSRLFSLKTRE